MLSFLPVVAIVVALVSWGFTVTYLLGRFGGKQYEKMRIKKLKTAYTWVFGPLGAGFVACAAAGIYPLFEETGTMYTTGMIIATALMILNVFLLYHWHFNITQLFGDPHQRGKRQAGRVGTSKDATIDLSAEMRDMKKRSSRGGASGRAGGSARKSGGSGKQGGSGKSGFGRRPGSGR